MNDEMSTAVAVRAPGALEVSGGRNPAALKLRLQQMIEEKDLVHDFFKAVMVPSTVGKDGKSLMDGDYGVIPGTSKPALLKPGAEKLCEFYGFAITIKSREEIADYTTGFLRVITTIQLVHRASGEIVCEGIGECNTKEARYADRWVFASDIPADVDRTKLKSKEITSKKNGRTFTMFLTTNDDPFTQWNTVTKMSKKRGVVDGTLSATRSSGFFAQGETALSDWVEGEYTALDDDDDDEPSTPTHLDTPPVSAPEPKPRPQAASAPVTPAPGPKGGFWSAMGAAGMSRDEYQDFAENESQRLYKNKSLQQLTDQERRGLLDFLIAWKKQQDAETPAAEPAQTDLPLA